MDYRLRTEAVLTFPLIGGGGRVVGGGCKAVKRVKRVKRKAQVATPHRGGFQSKFLLLDVVRYFSNKIGQLRVALH